MIVVFSFEALFVAGEAVGEFLLPGKAAFSEKFQCPVNGSEANGWILGSDDGIEILGT